MTQQGLLKVIAQAAKRRSTELNLNDKGLTALPPEIGQLTNLTRLQLAYNKLTALPREVGQLTNLTYLYLSDNQLTALPPEIGQLTNLTRLDLGGNRLTALPPEIGQLRNLKEINLYYNQLTALPPELGNLMKLEDLYLEGNSLVSPPPEVVAQGLQATLRYLREQQKASQPVWVSKLLVVGQGGVGKTELLRSLRDEPFIPELPTTHGIVIGPVFLKHPFGQAEPGQDVQRSTGVPPVPRTLVHGQDARATGSEEITMTLNAWDFGGQEIYHATHQFFLTNRSLFLLVWNARHDWGQGKLYYWLDAIQAKAPDSPVIIVATHIDERDARLPFVELKAKYPQVVGHCAVSNKTREGIEELRQMLTAAAAKLPLMGEKWPKTWLDAAEAIRARPEKHVTPGVMTQVMAAKGVKDKDAQVLARWLHELGDILYYPDDQELCDFVVLKPQWVTEYISKVLESQKVIDAQGVLAGEELERLWPDFDRGLREHFLRLMENFDLSYRTLDPNQREISLVVERLPMNPPEYEPKWDRILGEHPCRQITMRYQLNSMQAGIPTFFIARSHRFSTHTHWLKGALFADGRHLALVRADDYARTVELSVRGPAPYNFFALLKDGLELTLARFPGLKIERLMPCPGHDHVPCKHAFNYAHLERAIEREPPRLEMECSPTGERVSVPGLLFGLHWRVQDDVLKRLEELQASMSAMLAGQDEARRGASELLALIQRGFTNEFKRAQSDIDSYCPNVFVLRPKDRAGWLRRLAGQKVELQLYCQAPGQWHPTTKGGRYEMDIPADWLRVVGPYLKSLVKILKYAVPIVGAGAAIAHPEVRSDVMLMIELAKLLPESRDDFESRTLDIVGERREPEMEGGAALRAIRHLLDEKDPQQYWGGLRRILTPEGHYLWLCDYHAQEYKK